MTSTRSAPLLLCISLVSLPFLAGCSGEALETPAEDAGADVDEGEAPDPAEALERLRGLCKLGSWLDRSRFVRGKAKILKLILGILRALSA